MINALEPSCINQSLRKTFGLCDDRPGQKAYIDDQGINGRNWIATVHNVRQVDPITFIAIDHCVDFPKRPDGKDEKRCDCALIQTDKIAFVELKTSEMDGPEWVNDAFQQLVVSINYFENTFNLQNYTDKRGYICNNNRPKARKGQAERIQRFSDATRGYALYIKANIDLESMEG